MTASRLAASAMGPSANTPSSSGPLCAIRRAARTVQSVSGLVPSASARHPAIPDMRPLQRRRHLGWNRMPPSKRTTSAFM